MVVTRADNPISPLPLPGTCTAVKLLDYSVAFGRLLETACPCVLPSDFPQQVKDDMDDDELSR